MKKAVLLHGTDGSPQSNWLPWLKKELEARDYEVWVPDLPSNHTPNRKTYNNFLFNSGWDFKDNLIVGHSSGAVSILNLLEDPRCPHIGTGVMVGAWAHMDETDLDFEQFKETFPPDGFQFDTIKQKSDRLLFIHGDNDPYCPLDQAKWLAKKTGCEIIVIPDAGHINRDAGFTELPQLIDALQIRNWL